ncbi:MAG: hypothetical protein U9R66_05580, partial [Thermodesulfobacteriota bacterium]|nr:hypothetical protein [Thermodesulfobacteriota bacterium]
MPEEPADADNKSGFECPCLVRREKDAFAVEETGCPVRVSCSGLTLDEERRFSRNIRKFFGAACLLIQRKVFKKQNFAALQEEIGSWEPGGSSPVPQKRRVHRIRVEIADRAAQDDSFSRKLQRHVLALLDKVDRAAEELILGNMGLVHIIASQFHGKGVGREDLIQEGNIGLMKAA